MGPFEPPAERGEGLSRTRDREDARRAGKQLAQGTKWARPCRAGVRNGHARDMARGSRTEERDAAATPLSTTGHRVHCSSHAGRRGLLPAAGLCPRLHEPEQG